MQNEEHDGDHSTNTGKDLEEDIERIYGMRDEDTEEECSGLDS